MAIPMWAVNLEYQVLGALHLAASYARWAGGYGDADVLARTNGYPTVYLETGNMTTGSSIGLPAVTRTSTTPTQITVPLDAITDDPRNSTSQHAASPPTSSPTTDNHKPSSSTPTAPSATNC